MPMTARQLKGGGEDYAEFLPISGEVVACEEARPSRKSTCDICGEPFEREYKWIDTDGFERVDWAMRSAKQIVVHVAAFGLRIRHYRLLVCRQGVKCRQVRLAEMAAERPEPVTPIEWISSQKPHVVSYALGAK